MTARWHEALDSQAQAFAFYDSPRGQSYARGWANSWGPGGGMVHGRTGEPLSDRAVQLYREYTSAMSQLLLGAVTLYIDPDMMSLVDAAAETFDPEPLLPTDIPCPHGFLYLPHPIIMSDRHGTATSVRAFAWATTDGGGESRTDGLRGVPGIVLFLLHREGDADAYSNPNLSKTLSLNPDDLLIGHVFPWPFNAEYGEDILGGLRQSVKPLLAAWRLMQQTIAVVSQERPPRATRRRLPDPMVENMITVVKLRRPRKDQDPDHEPGNVEWSMRWIVSGHWRQHWFPSLSAHRQIWIGNYQKGPEDKPLVIRKAHVLNLAR